MTLPVVVFKPTNAEEFKARLCSKCHSEMRLTYHAYGRNCKNAHRRDSYRFHMRGRPRLKPGRPFTLSENPSRSTLRRRILRDSNATA